MSQYAPCVSPFPMTDKSWNLATAVGTNVSGAVPSTQLSSPSSSPKVSRISASYSTSPNGGQQQQAAAAATISSLGNKVPPFGGSVTGNEFLPSLMNTPGAYGPLSQFHAYRHGGPVASGHSQQHQFWTAATSTQAVPSANSAAVSPTFTSRLGSLESVSGYYLHQKPNYATTSMAAAQTSLDQHVSNAQDRWMQARLLLPPPPPSLSQGPPSSQSELVQGASADAPGGAQGPQQLAAATAGGCDQLQFLSVKTEPVDHQPLNQSSPAKLLNSMQAFHTDQGLFQGFQGKSSPSSLGVQMSPRDSSHRVALGSGQIRYPVPTTIVSPGSSPYDQFHATVSPVNSVDANRGAHYGVEQASPNTTEATRLILKIKSSMLNERCHNELPQHENRRPSEGSLAESDDVQSQVTVGSPATSESSAHTGSTQRESAGATDPAQRESSATLSKGGDNTELAADGKYGEASEASDAHVEGSACTVPAAHENNASDADGASSPSDANSNVHQYFNEKTGVTTYVCHCGFTNESKFHFNSHMNTHADHKCDICDYTSRTEGRLKRHMKQFHSPGEDANATGATAGTEFSQKSEPSTGQDVVTVKSENSSSFYGEPLSEQEAFEVHLQSVINGQQQQQQQQQSLVPPTSIPMGDPSMFLMSNANSSSVSSTTSSSCRPKTYRCKQCSFVANSKNDFWIHQRTHIKSDKQLACPKCPFITEYKHHLEYHLRNHFNSKPFKCSKCNYSCVNKSMLNSHMKSHSNFYQYRCADCTYATKYCHSLKLHLRKYGHSAATVINPDGSSGNAVTIDVFGNRRGPRQKRTVDQTSVDQNLSVGMANGVVAGLGVQTSVAGSGGNGGAGGVGSTADPMGHLDVGMGNLVVPLMQAFQNNMLAQAAAVSHQKTAAAMAASGGGLGSLTGAARMMSVPGFLPLQSNASMSPSMVQKCCWCDHVATSREALAKHLLVHKDMLRVMSMLSSNGGGSSAFDNEVGRLGYGDVGMLEFVAALAGQEAIAAAAPVNGMWTDMLPVTSTPLPAGADRYLPTQSPEPNMGSLFNGCSSSSISIYPSLGMDAPGVSSSSSRRKSKAFKLDLIAMRLQGRHTDSVGSCSSGDLMDTTEEGTVDSNRRPSLPDYGAAADNDHEHSSDVQRPRSATISMMQRLQQQSCSTKMQSSSNQLSCLMPGQSSESFGHGGTSAYDWSNAFVCNYCLIAFKDCVMYNIHMVEPGPIVNVLAHLSGSAPVRVHLAKLGRRQ
uniref:C2H2-type domain-containing protein n=1 Tax=Trichuris muris TaxID=70415 RepID=A0A5S6R4L9_TRIMR